MPRNSYFENNYPFPVHNPKFKEKHAMLYTKHKTNITNLTQIYPRKTQTRKRNKQMIMIKKKEGEKRKKCKSNRNL